MDKKFMLGLFIVPYWLVAGEVSRLSPEARLKQLYDASEALDERISALRNSDGPDEPAAQDLDLPFWGLQRAPDFLKEWAKNHKALSLQEVNGLNFVDQLAFEQVKQSGWTVTEVIDGKECYSLQPADIAFLKLPVDHATGSVTKFLRRLYEAL